VRTAAAWLGANQVVARPDRSVRLTRGERWVDVVPGSVFLGTPTGLIVLPQKVRVVQGHTMVALTPLVRALGGTARFDETGKLSILLPEPPQLLSGRAHQAARHRKPEDPPTPGSGARQSALLDRAGPPDRHRPANREDTLVPTLGRDEWKNAAPLLTLVGDRLVVAWASGFFACDARTGRLRWETPPHQYSIDNAVLIGNVVLVSTYESGAIGYSATIAYDLHTGERLWHHFGPVQRIENEQVVLRYSWPVGDESPSGLAFITSTVEIKSGKILHQERK
jgi:hypothetical protein